MLLTQYHLGFEIHCEDYSDSWISVSLKNNQIHQFSQYDSQESYVELLTPVDPLITSWALNLSYYSYSLAYRWTVRTQNPVPTTHYYTYVKVLKKF